MVDACQLCLTAHCAISTNCASIPIDIAIVSAAGQEAQLLVPAAMEIMHQSTAAQQAWTSHWQGIPLHLLLPWAAQMLSLLDEPEGRSFLPALKVDSCLASMDRMHTPILMQWKVNTCNVQAHCCHLQPCLTDLLKFSLFNIKELSCMDGARP